MTFGRLVLKNSYYANARMAIRLVSRLLLIGASALNERYWARFLLVVFLPSTLLCLLPQPSHAGQLEIGDSVDQGHCK